MIRVLLVEDDAMIREMTRIFLESQKRFEVVCAASGEEALAHAKDPFDVILLDILLPDTNGMQLCQTLRSGHHCPIIFTSCLDDVDTIVHALELGGDDFLTKPYDNKVLAALGLPPLTPEQDAYTFMATARQALEYIVPPEMHQRMYEVVRTEVIYSRDIVPLLQIYPGYREFLELAHGHGMRLAVHTNRTAEGMQRVLDFLALPSYFNPVVTATEAAPKTAPDGVRLILEQWGADPEQVLFVGDSPNDQKAATAAGVVFAAFGGELQGPLAAAGYDELAGLLQNEWE